MEKDAELKAQVEAFLDAIDFYTSVRKELIKAGGDPESLTEEKIKLMTVGDLIKLCMPNGIGLRVSTYRRED